MVLMSACLCVCVCVGVCFCVCVCVHDNSKNNGSIGHIANSIFLLTGGRKEPMAEIFAGNQLETPIAVHTNHHSPSLVL